MAYRDDETPEKRGAGLGTLFVFGAVTAVVVFTSILVAGIANISWRWLIVPSLIIIAAMGLGLWLSMRRRKAMHLDDEFHKLRFRWTRTYGLAAAMFIFLPVYIGVRYLKYLPNAVSRVVMALVPHPDDFANGMMFVVLTIVLCSLAADGIWQLRHK